MKRTINFSIFLIGFTAMASQIIYMREFLVVFYGNELSIGFILASWLFGGFVGSFLLGRYSDALRRKTLTFSLCQIVLAVMLPLNIAAIRLIKTVLGVNPGEVIAFFPILASSFLIMVPVCVILGFLFSLASRVYGSQGAPGAGSIGKVYVIEAFGSMAGGLLASFILIRLFSSMAVIAMISFLNIACAIFLLFMDRKKHLFVLSAAGLLLILFAATWLFNGWNRLDGQLLKKEWSGYDLIASQNSIYGNVTLTKSDGQISFFNNGLHLYSVPNKLVSEEAVHFALLEHPDPKNVLLIGGGVGGLMEEVLKHPVERVDYVELDPLIVEMASKYLEKARCSSLWDERVRIINSDGRFFVKRAKERYDCIIIDLGDPYTAQLNRFYTAEFFKEAAGILKKGGVISFGVTSSENYINRELSDFLSSVYATLKKAFPAVVVIPGDTAYFLASNKDGMLTYDYHLMMDRANKRKLYLEYVREYYLFSKLSPKRVSYIESMVRRGKRAKINHDLRPISYYYDMIFWSSRFRDSLFTRALKAVTAKLIWGVAVVFYILFFVFKMIVGWFRGGFKRIVLIAVMAAGFSSLALQVIILVSFQIIYGYLFYKLGIILTLFMVGLALGGVTMLKILPALKKARGVFALIQCAFSAYPIALALSLWGLASFKGEIVSWLGANLLFPLLPALAGFIGGLQFPLANKLYLDRPEDVGRTAGLTYGVDLFGSALGAILTGAILIPILGIPQACLLVSVTNLVILFGLL